MMRPMTMIMSFAVLCAFCPEMAVKAQAKADETEGSHFDQGPMPAHVAQAEVSAFIDAFLRFQFQSAVTNNIPLVIEETLSIKRLGKPDDLFREADNQGGQISQTVREAIRDFCEKNRSDGNLADLGSLTTAHVVLSKEERENIYASRSRSKDPNIWQAPAVFRERYPHSPGIITLSYPGFSADGTLAVLYVGRQLDWEGPYGQIHVFEKQDGKWRKWTEGDRCDFFSRTRWK